jgi:hypothetical protein
MDITCESDFEKVLAIKNVLGVHGFTEYLPLLEETDITSMLLEHTDLWNKQCIRNSIYALGESIEDFVDQQIEWTTAVLQCNIVVTKTRKKQFIIGLGILLLYREHLRKNKY